MLQPRTQPHALHPRRTPRREGCATLPRVGGAPTSLLAPLPPHRASINAFSCSRTCGSSCSASRSLMTCNAMVIAFGPMMQIRPAGQQAHMAFAFSTCTGRLVGGHPAACCQLRVCSERTLRGLGRQHMAADAAPLPLPHTSSDTTTPRAGTRCPARRSTQLAGKRAARTAPPLRQQAARQAAPPSPA